jgi:hypothetical protein
MNIYLLIYCSLHAGIVVILFFNVLFQFGRLKSLRLPVGQNVKAIMEVDRNTTRARSFLIRSVIGLIATIFFQGFAFWLLGMAGVFDK